MSIRFVNPAATVKAIPLVHPIDIDGIVLHTVNVKRLTAGEVAGFVEALKKAEGDNRPLIPIFTDPAGVLLNKETLDALDADDFETLDEAAIGFLPRRLRLAAETTDPALTESTQSTGEAGVP